MKIVLVASVCLLASCTTMKYAMNQKIISNENCVEISAKGIPVFEVSIDDNKHKMLFDSGAMISVVNDSNVISGFSNKKIGTFGSYAGADRKKKKSQFLTARIKSDLFESDNKMFLFSQIPKAPCQKGSAFKGIIGLDAIIESELSLSLEFSKNKICNINRTAVNSRLINESFIQLKSKCKQNQIFVFLNIEGKEYPFKLDTGYTGSIIMPYSEKLDFKNENKIEMEGAVYQTISSHTNGKELIYEKMPISFAGQNFESKINVSSSIKAQNIGIEFIRAFDWLIDYNNNKVYVKRNQNKIESTFSRKVSYYAKANQAELRIVVKEKSQTKFHLGDQIIAVNNQKVTAENSCELQDLLNKTDDWNTFQLEVIPQKN